MGRVMRVFFFLMLFASTSFAATKTELNEHYDSIRAQAKDLSPKVLKLALAAYFRAREQGLDDKKIMTIVDYTLPSNKKRMWVFDVEQNKLLHHTLVSHGSGSGLLYAKHFSNVPETHKSSVGLFLTKNDYKGVAGYSLRLKGLEPGINDRAESRTIVMHGAHYADHDFIEKYGRLGRSEGCFALPTANYTDIIHDLVDGTLIFAYYPEKYWLKHSKYLA